MSRGAEAVYAIRGAGGSRDTSIGLKGSVLLVLRSASEISARPRASRLSASYLNFPIREVELVLLDSPIHQVGALTL